MSSSKSGKPGLMSLPFMQTVYIPAALVVAGTALTNAKWLPYVLIMAGAVCGLTLFSGGQTSRPSGAQASKFSKEQPEKVSGGKLA